MIFEGDQSVIEAIKEKKRLKDAGAPHAHIKPLLVIDGGLMKGAYGVGAGLALEESGYSTAFSNVVGISSGAPSAAYLVAGEVYIGAGLVWDECCSKAFINKWRVWNQVNTNHLIDAVRGATGKGLDTEKVFAAPTELYIGVSNFSTGEPSLLKPQDGEGLFQAIQASILMPNVSTDKVTIDDIRYVDGGFTRPHILKKAIDEIEATHVLVITNQDYTATTIPRLERFLNHTLFRWRMPKPLRFAAHERRKERMKAIAYLEKEYGKPYALVWGDHSIKSTEQDPYKVRAVIEKSRTWWKELLQD